MATATLNKTNANALRGKLFGGGTSLSVPSSAPTTDALKQATDRILKEQAQSQQHVELYRQKLQDAQEHVKRLGEAYLAQATLNGKLQAKVQEDYKQLETLSNKVKAISASHGELSLFVNNLQGELQRVEAERGELQGAFNSKFQICEEVNAKLDRLTEHSAALQTKLEEGHQARVALSEEMVALKQEVAVKQADIARLQAEMDTARDEGEQRASQLGEELAAAKSRCGELEAELSASKTEMAEAATAHNVAAAQLSSQITAGKEKELRLEMQLVELDVKAAGLQEKIEGLEQAQAGLEEALKSKEESLAAQTTELSGVKAELEKTKVRLAEQEEACGTKEEELEALRAEKERLEAIAEERGADIEKQTQEYAALESKTKQDMEALGQEKAELEAKLGATENEIKGLAESLDQALRIAQKKKRDAEQQLENQVVRTGKAVEEMKAKHKSELEAKAQELEALQQDYAALQQANAELQEAKKAMEEAHAKALQNEYILKSAVILQERHNKSQQLVEMEGRILDINKAHAAEVLKLRNEAAAAAAQAAQDKASLEQRLDELSASWRTSQSKLEEVEKVASECEALLKAKDEEIAQKASQLLATKQEVEKMERELQQSQLLRQTIPEATAVAVQTSQQPEPDALPATLPTQVAATLPTQVAATLPTQPAAVKSQEPAAEAAAGADEEQLEPGPEPVMEEEISEPQAAAEEPEERPAAVAAAPKPAAAALAAERPRGSGRASQRAAPPARAAAPQRPIIDEPSDSDTDSEASEQEEERQARGRKRSGKTVNVKAQASKKTKKAPIIPAGRRMGGMFSMMTASQGASQGGKGGARAATKATATSGRNRAVKDKKASKPTESPAQPAGLLNIFGGLPTNSIYSQGGGSDTYDPSSLS